MTTEEREAVAAVIDGTDRLAKACSTLAHSTLVLLRRLASGHEETPARRAELADVCRQVLAASDEITAHIARARKNLVGDYRPGN